MNGGFPNLNRQWRFDDTKSTRVFSRTPLISRHKKRSCPPPRHLDITIRRRTRHTYLPTGTSPTCITRSKPFCSSSPHWHLPVFRMRTSSSFQAPDPATGTMTGSTAPMLPPVTAARPRDPSAHAYRATIAAEMPLQHLETQPPALVLTRPMLLAPLRREAPVV